MFKTSPSRKNPMVSLSYFHCGLWVWREAITCNQWRIKILKAYMMQRKVRLNQNLLVVPSCFLNLFQHEGMYNKLKNHRESSFPLFRNIKKESILSRENFGENISHPKHARLAKILYELFPIFSLRPLRLGVRVFYFIKTILPIAVKGFLPETGIASIL